MKQLLYILLGITLFTSCSSDDNNDAPAQDYTSLVFYQPVDNNLPNCVAAYKKDGKYIKLGNLGDLKKGVTSPEVRINDNSIREVYFFSDFLGGVRFDAVYSLKSNIKNMFTLASDTKGIPISDKTDPTQYPQ